MAKQTSKKAPRKKSPRKKAPKAVELDRPAIPPVPPPIPIGRVLGQRRAIESLDRALASDRLHHAFIFHGPRGVGKLTTALAFAAILLDPDAETDLAGSVRAPELSRTAELLAGGSHPDLHVVRRQLASVSSDEQVRRRMQTNIPIEVVREFLVEPASRTAARPAGSGARAGQVFIVDEAELLANAAQDTLLKTLEEPGPGTVLILITQSEHELQPTIRSRCQRLAFGPLEAETLLSWAKDADLDLGHLGDKDRDWLLAYADGSPGVLASAIEAGLDRWPAMLRPILTGIARGTPDPLAGPELAKLASAAAEARVAGARNASKASANRAVMDELVAFIGAWLRGAMGFAADRGSPGTAPWSRAIAALDEVHRLMDSNVNVSWVAESIVVQLAEAFRAHATA